jgi:hypothetical protein
MVVWFIIAAIATTCAVLMYQSISEARAKEHRLLQVLHERTMMDEEALAAYKNMIHASFQEEWETRNKVHRD